MIRSLLLALLLLAPLAASAPPSWVAARAQSEEKRDATPRERPTAGRVVSVVDGDTVVLASGVEVRLVGIMAPKLSLGRARVPTQPLAEAARAALVEMVEGREVRLWYGGAPWDRHGRALAHLHDADGRWIQGEMLRRGLARVYSFADNRARVAEMLAAEREARTAGRGVWALRVYRPRRVEETPR